jgi:iron complex outermembrane receptor protein
MVRASLWATYDRFQDPLGEFPSGSPDQQDWSLGVGLRGRLSWAPHASQLLALLPDYRFDHYQGRDPGRDLPTAVRNQLGIALRDRMSFWRDRLGITPVVRLDLLWHQVAGTDGSGTPLADAFTWFASPRLGVRVSPVSGLTLRGNVGRYFRPPTLFELYGDRGTTVGNPQLVPETGLSGDLGVLLQLTGRRLSRWGVGRWLRGLRAEATFFGRDVSDLIGWVRNSPHTTTARNIARAVAYGVETHLAAWVRLGGGVSARLSAAYTYLHTENRSGQPLIDGNQLPGRPVHEVRGRLDLAWRRGRWAVGAHYGISHDSESYLDEANLFLPVPQRTLHEVGLTLAPWIPGFRLSATVRNVTDVRVELQRAPAGTGLDRIPRPLMDFAGFPLPGWQVWVTAAWKG